MEATQQSPSPSAAAKPDWKLWKERKLEGNIPSGYQQSHDHRVRKEFGGSGSCCSCCGAIWINPEGGYRPYDIYEEVAPYKGDPQYNYARDQGKAEVQQVKNRSGIYLGNNQSIETLKKNMDLPDDINTLVIEDGDQTHVLAWKDE